MLTYLPDAVALRLTWMYDAPSRGRAAGQGLLQKLADALKDRREVEFPVHDYRGITYVWEVVRHLEEAMGLPGGNAQEAGMCGILGGYSGQEEKKFAFPSYPFDPKALTDWAMDEYHYAADPKLIYRLPPPGGRNPGIGSPARVANRWIGWPTAVCTGVWARFRCTWPRSARRWTTTC